MKAYTRISLAAAMMIAAGARIPAKAQTGFEAGLQGNFAAMEAASADIQKLVANPFSAGENINNARVNMAFIQFCADKNVPVCKDAGTLSSGSAAAAAVEQVILADKLQLARRANSGDYKQDREAIEAFRDAVASAVRKPKAAAASPTTN